MGAACLAWTGEKSDEGMCYEVEVLKAEGELLVGFAGTSLGPQCTVVGNDACSWGFFSGDGNGWHGCARPGRGREGALQDSGNDGRAVH